MIALIILFRNQSANARQIAQGIAKQSKTPDNIYLMLDRPSSSEIEEITDAFKDLDGVRILLNTTIPKLREGSDVADPFLAGFCRDIAVKQAWRDGHDIFIFIDGDCIPQSKLVECHVKVLDSKYPVISQGRRREKQYQWKDRREVDAGVVQYGIFRTPGYLLSSPDLLRSAQFTWSCNLGINRNAIALVMKLNNEYYQRVELFNSDFNGAWGGEDSFLGIQAYVTRCFITAINDIESGIMHIDHPRKDNPMKHQDFFIKQVEILKKIMARKPLAINFFID